MAVFIDTSFFVAYSSKGDANHGRAKELLAKAVRGDYGHIYTSDYVVDETLTTVLARTKSHKDAVKIGEYILESEIVLLTVPADVFLSSWNMFKNTPRSFTDCTIVALMQAYKINYILTFDREFTNSKSVEVLR